MRVTQLAVEHLINVEAYPIGDERHPQRNSTIKKVREQLDRDGCAVLKNFFSPQGLKKLCSEASERAPLAYFSEQKKINVYLSKGNPELPSDHPQNVQLERTNGFVRADEFDDTTCSQRLYYWPPLKQFLAECLGKDELFIYEDPVSNMIVNVLEPGQQFNWHFDTNEFTITMMLQEAESGGLFEYVPDIRSANDECYEEVNRVIRGERDRVKRLELKAGDLQLFLGRFSLHRVTPNTGQNNRLLLIMSFTNVPGMVGNRVRIQKLYGKTTPVHLEQENQPVRADKLLD